MLHVMVVSVCFERACSELGAGEGLTGIETAVAGEGIADEAGGGKVEKPAVSEKLNGEEDRGDGTVGRAAEDADQTDGGGKAGVDS